MNLNDCDGRYQLHQLEIARLAEVERHRAPLLPPPAPRRHPVRKALARALYALAARLAPTPTAVSEPAITPARG
ncbi:MAG: hypothetical protein ACTHMA_14845 [Thermomicrobiales bacterium]|jgi:hypothetical protein|nr:hypothetical protein [Thermomicrobiales bacterium]